MKKIILFLLLTSFAFADLTFDLKNAIKKNDVKKITSLLEKGAIPDADTVNQALKDENYELFKLLVSTNLNVNSLDSEKVSIFTNACIYGNKEIIEMLLSKEPGIDNKGAFGNTPIYAAVKKDNVEAVEILIREGASVNNYNNAWYSPLMIAASNNSKNVTQVLIDNGAKLDYGFREFTTAYSPVLVACAKNSKEVLEILIANGADLNDVSKDGVTPLMFAAATNSVDVMEILLRENPELDLDASARTTDNALLFAAEVGAKEAVEFLVLNGADIEYENKYGKTALMIAKAKNKREVVNFLIEQGAQE